MTGRRASDTSVVHGRFRSGVALIAITLLVTAGCSATSDDQGATSTPTPTPTSTATSTATIEMAVGAAPAVAGPGADDAVEARAGDDPIEAAPSTDPPAAEPAAAGEPLSEDDLERFVAAAESAIEGTSAEGVVVSDPEIYIAIGQAACARFSAGEGFVAVASGLLDELAPGGPSSDDERLVGALLGSATRTICPEHADLI